MIPAPGSRRILQERCWKLTGSCRKTPEMAGRWKQYSGRKLTGFFRWIPAKFLCFPAGINRKSLEKILKIPYRNTASMKSPEYLGTGRFRAEMFDLGKKLWLHWLKGSHNKTFWRNLIEICWVGTQDINVLFSVSHLWNARAIHQYMLDKWCT